MPKLYSVLTRSELDLSEDEYARRLGIKVDAIEGADLRPEDLQNAGALVESLGRILKSAEVLQRQLTSERGRNDALREELARPHPVAAAPMIEPPTMQVLRRDIEGYARRVRLTAGAWTREYKAERGRDGKLRRVVPVKEVA